MNNFRFIKRILYSLKRRYGLPITIHRATSSEVDIINGEQTQEITTYKIKKAVVLNTKQARDFAYDLSYIAANKNFTYGALFDAGTRTILIDAIDLPTGFILLQDDGIIYNHERYEIK